MKALRGALVVLVLATAVTGVRPAALASTPPRTRVLVLVNGLTQFDKTVAAAAETDAGLNVLIAGQNAAMDRGATELDVISGTTLFRGDPPTIEIAVDVAGEQDEVGDDGTGVVQAGASSSGDAIGGQVLSVSTPGGSSVVHQTNVSTNVRTHTGASSGSSSTSGGA